MHSWSQDTVRSSSWLQDVDRLTTKLLLLPLLQGCRMAGSWDSSAAGSSCVARRGTV